MAKISEVCDFRGGYEIEEIKFIKPEEIGNFISWWNTSNGGKVELAEALKKIKYKHG